jgi:hypothetical protein
MTRRTVGLLFFVYFVAAVGFATSEAMQDPFWSASAAEVGRIAGGALTIYILGAILPMIGWAVMRFKASSAAGPLLFWLLISGVLAYFSYEGTAAERKLKLEKFASNGGLVGREKDDFLTSTKQGCEARQKSSLLTKRVNISDAKIAVYCDCYAQGMAEAMTIDELRSFATNGKAPTSVNDQAATLGRFCGEQVLGQKQ